MDNYRRTSHTKFDIKLHFVWITKFRKPLLVGTIATRLRDLVRQICTELEVDMPNFVPIGMECLEMKAFEVAQEINNDQKLLPEFFHHAKLAL